MGADLFGTSTSSGLFDNAWVSDFLFGGVEGPSKSGAFPNLPKMGKAYSEYLLKRMNTETTDLPEWDVGKGAIQDAVAQQGATARQRLGDAGASGGFMDSGQIARGESDIARSEMTSFSGALRDMFMQLETSKYSGVLPYLSGGSQDFNQFESMKLQGQLTKRGQDVSFGQSVLGMFDFF